MKTNQGLTKIFGYSKTEVMGHFVNILMPSLFAKRHNEFLEKFFKTGHKTVFNTERLFYGLHRNGFCFCIKMLVKQLPSLVEGIQYVGMIRQSQADCDYILTDMRGVVDCFSSGITSLLNLPANLFKDSDVNVQILAPELIKVFSATDKKRTLLGKFQEPGGQKLTFVVPKDFAFHAQSDSKKNARDLSKNIPTKGGNMPTASKKTKNPTYRDLNKDLNKHNGIASKQVTAQQLLQSYEYRECETRQTVKCEILEPTYGEEHKDIDPLKIRVFKVTGINMKRGGSGADQSSDMGEAYAYAGSHSNASGDYKESKGHGGSQNEPSKHEEKQDLMNFVVNSPMDSKPKPTPTPKADDDEKQSQRREETKTTERVPGNTITTEHVETLEAKPMLKVKLAADPKTGEIRKSAKEILSVGKKDDKKEEKKDDKKEQQQAPDEVKSAYSQDALPLPGQPGRSASDNVIKSKEDVKAPPKKDESKKEEAKKEEEGKDSEESTPRMDIGNLKGPEYGVAASHVAEENTVHPLEESAFESESGKSTGRANAKEPVKEEKRAGTKVASGRLSEEAKAKKQGAGGKANTIVDAKAQQKDSAKRGSVIKKEKDGSSNNDDSHKKADEEDKEEEDESKEDVGPLDSKVKTDSKMSQGADLKNVKVPSILDDVIVKPASEEKKRTHETFSVASREKSKPDEEGKSDKKLTLGKAESDAEAIKTSEPKLDSERIQKQTSKESVHKIKDTLSKNTSQDEPKKIVIHRRGSVKGQKRYTSKIITNPMYDAEGKEITEYPEYKPTEDEMKVRRALLAFDKKKNKEKKKGVAKEKKEEKKVEEEKDENGEEKKEDEKEDEEDDEDKEDKKEEAKVMEEGDENQDTQSSVTSGSTGSTMRSFYSLRAAIDEKYIPLSIRNMSCSANIVFLLLLGLASKILHSA